VQAHDLVITSIVYTKHGNSTLDLAQSLMTAAEHPGAAMLLHAAIAAIRIIAGADPECSTMRRPR
jgi:shikimate 5-dehydrogenase